MDVIPRSTSEEISYRQAKKASSVLSISYNDDNRVLGSLARLIRLIRFVFGRANELLSLYVRNDTYRVGREVNFLKDSFKQFVPYSTCAMKLQNISSQR